MFSPSARFFLLYHKKILWTLVSPWTFSAKYAIVKLFAAHEITHMQSEDFHVI